MMSRYSRNTLRQAVLAKRDGLSPGELINKSASLVARILDLDAVKNAAVVFSYMHFRSEVRTMELIRAMLAADKTVTIPLTVPEESRLRAVGITDPVRQVKSGYRGIPEPRSSPLANAIVDPGDIDVVFVPGSVFDCSGGRLGYGGGYYDRFLGLESPQALRIGLAFDLQVVDRIPLQPHDQRMDWVVTESKLYQCRRT